MILTNSKKVMGARINSRGTNALGWATTAITFLCAIALVASWLRLW